MSIYKKAFLINFAIFSLLILVQYWLVPYFILDKFIVLEKNEAVSDVKRISNIIDESLGGLYVSLSDNSMWDDTYQFMRDRNEGYVESNYYDKAFPKLKIDLLMFVDETGEVVLASGIDEQTGKKVPLPNSAVSFFKSAEISGAMDSAENGIRGISSVDSKPTMYAAHRILTSLEKGPSRGYSVYGRVIDSGFIKGLVEGKCSAVSLFDISGGDTCPTVLTASDAAGIAEDLRCVLASPDGFHIKTISEDTLEIFVCLKDFQSRPTILMRADFARNIYKHGKYTAWYFSIIIMILLTVAGVINFRLLNSLVLSRLKKLEALVVEVGSGSSYEARLAIEGDDEIANLSREVNSMLDSIDRSRKELGGEIERHKKTLVELSKLTEAVDQSSSTVIITDSRGFIEYVNPAFTRVSGYELHEAIGRKTSIVKSGKHAPQFYENLWSTVKSGKVWAGEFCNRSKRGELYWELASITPIVDPSGKITNFISVAEDITGRKAMEAELVAAKDRADEANVAKSRFIANMSHEIRTPLHGVIGFAELLLQSDLLPDQLEMVDLLKKSAHILMSILNDILDISKIEAGKIVLEKIEFDLHQLLMDVYFVSNVKAREKGLLIDCSFGTGGAFKVIGDPVRLRQVLLNLVNNAIKFTERGKIDLRATKLSADRSGVEFRFEVEDRGIGISEDKLGEIFSPFVQADTTTTRMFGGTGLGLSISNNLVKLMGGGKISVVSEPERGSRFYFTLKFPAGSGS